MAFSRVWLIDLRTAFLLKQFFRQIDRLDFVFKINHKLGLSSFLILWSLLHFKATSLADKFVKEYVYQLPSHCLRIKFSSPATLRAFKKQVAAFLFPENRNRITQPFLCFFVGIKHHVLATSAANDKDFWSLFINKIISSFSSTKNKNKYGLFGNATSRCMTHLMFLFAPDSQEAFFRELKHRQFQRLQHPHTTDLIVQVLTGPSSLNPFSSDHTCLCIKNVKWLFAYINILSSNCWLRCSGPCVLREKLPDLVYVWWQF